MYLDIRADIIIWLVVLWLLLLRIRLAKRQFISIQNYLKIKILNC